MGLVKLTRVANELQTRGCVVKELSGKFYVLLIKDGVPACYETRDAPAQAADGQFHMPADAKQVQVYVDDGLYWIHHVEEARPQTAKWAPPQSTGFGLGQLVQQGGMPTDTAPPPPPLVPFAGLDKKALPPSPLLHHKQAKHIEPVGKGASRKLPFAADQGQKQIMDYFGASKTAGIAAMEF